MIHGGDIYRNEIDLDFSVNLNPLGTPDSVMKALQSALAQCGHYPDLQYEKLKIAISEREGVKAEKILLGNGASECLSTVLQYLRPEKILLPIPSFYGYRHAASSVGAEIREYPLREELDFRLDENFLKEIKPETGLLILTSPGNPSGLSIPEKLLERIFQRTKEAEIPVLLDECFTEFTESFDAELRRKWLKEFPNLMLLRAFTKSYSIPGVRFGYLLSSDEAGIQKMQQQLPEWNLSVFSEAAGIAAAGEVGFSEKTKEYLKTERERFIRALDEIFWDYQRRVKIYPSDANFFLLRTSYPLYEKMLEKKILLRDCSNFAGLGEGYYRIAVKKQEENLIFLNRLKNCFEEDANFSNITS